jgi:putative protease
LIAIKKELPDLELEVFVHGSMCFAYSGRCLISTLQSGRVPNRGSCANDCRFAYRLYAENPENGTLLKLEEETEVGTYIMNAKDLNLAKHIKEIIDSGVVDSFKIEGRTKSSYYTALTTRTYRQAINDVLADNFHPEYYEKELNTTQNRGFTDGYLIHKPFEKNDTQTTNNMMITATHQVSGIVLEEGYFLCKFTTKPHQEIEIISPEPLGEENIIENKIGKIFKRDDIWFVVFYKLIAQDGKEWESVHSGNLNPIQLPGKLPINSFLRVKI